MRKFLAVDPVRADEHHGDHPGFHQFRQFAGREPAIADPDIGIRDFLLHLFLDETEHLLLLFAAHAVQEQRAVVIEHQFDIEAPPPRRQGQTVGAAAAMTGSHEDGGELAPDPKLQNPVEFQRRIKGFHRHHQGRRATGEIQSLFIIGRHFRWDRVPAAGAFPGVAPPYGRRSNRGICRTRGSRRGGKD